MKSARHSSLCPLPRIKTRSRVVQVVTDFLGIGGKPRHGADNSTVNSNLALNTTTAVGRKSRFLSANALVLAGCLAACASNRAEAQVIVLGAASTYAVLANTTVTNTGAVFIGGDLGLTPGTSITGSPTVTGTTHINDSFAAAAQTDATTAFNQLAAFSPTQVLSGTSGTLGGLTLTPGVYSFGTSAALTGTLTLDGLGQCNPLFVFQIGTSLTSAAASSVVLSNFALAGNVWWQVGTSTSFGALTAFKGSIIANTSNALGAGVTLDGRAISLTTAVTLNTNSIIVPNEPTAYWNGTLGTNVWGGGSGTSTTNWRTTADGSAAAAIPCQVTNVFITANTPTNFYATTVLDTDYRIKTLTFTGTGTANTAGSIISGNILTLDGAAGITVDVGSGANTIASDVVLGTADTNTWTNNSANQLTVSGDVSGADKHLVFDGAGRTTVSGSLNLGGGTMTKVGTGTLTLSGATTSDGGITISTGMLQLGDGGTTGSITGDVTNNAALRYNRSNNFTFSGNISGTGTLATDAGQLTLSGTNTYSGDTTVNSGSTLVLAAADALGSGATMVASGGTLALQDNIRDDNQTSITLSGTGHNGAGAIRNISGINTVATAINLSADATITSELGTLNLGIQGTDNPWDHDINLGANTLTIDSDSGATVAFRYDITGTGGITKTGEGDLLLNNGWNTYTGDTNINDGKLILSPYTYSASFPSNYGLTSDVIVGDDIGAANSAIFQMGDGVESDPAEYIRDTQNITVNSDGYWNLQGFKETIANLTVNGGTIDAQESGGSLNERLDVTGVITASTGALSTTSTINGLLGMNNDAAKSIVVNAGATLDIEANLSNGGFLKTGTGILELSGGNTFTGVAQIDAGIVRVNNNNGLGAVGSGAVGTGVTVTTTDAQLRLEDVTIGAEALSLTGDGVSGGGALRSESGTNSWAGVVSLTGDAEIETATGSSLLISGNISGGGNTLTVEAIGDTLFTGINSFGTLEKTGAGTLTVTNTNTYGTANISDGTFTLGANNILSDSIDLNVTGTGHFNVGNFAETVRDINGNGTVTVDSGGNLVIDNLGNTGSGFQGTLDIDGVMTLNGGLISGGTGAGSTGEMILTAGNTLEIASDYTFGTVGTTGGSDQLGTFTLADNATLLISGNSIVNIGILNIAGDSILDFTGGANYNTLNLGSLTFEVGASLTVNGWNSFGDLWTSQNFPGATLDIRDDDTAKITFSGFTNDQTIWLTSDFGSKEITVPEPSSYGAILMGFGLGFWLCRRGRPAVVGG